MRGRPKARKAKSRSKAGKGTRSRSSKSKKTSKARKTSKALKTSKATAKRKTSRKQAPARKIAPARKKAGRKTGSRVSGRSRTRKGVFGEGNYTASREFRREETGFVRRNRNRIPELGEEAAEALEGSEGNELGQAEDTARSHSAGDDAGQTG